MALKNIDPIVSTQSKDETVKAEVWVVPEYKKKEDNTNPQSAVLEQRITDLKMQIEELDDSIYNLENTADGIDYAVAAAAGVIAGVIDSLFIDEFSLENSTGWTNEKLSRFIGLFARKEGYSGDSSGELSFLQNKYGAGNELNYHPSIFGLVLSVVTAVAGISIGVGKGGITFTNTASDLGLADRLFRGIADWGCHTVCGYTAASVKSNGLPGPINSLLKKSANINTLNVTSKNQAKLSGSLNQAFSGALKSSNAKSFSLQQELGVLAQIGSQAIPVIINEAIVRAFYFIRRFFMEISVCGVKSIHDLYKVDWSSTLPFGNRTIARMMTVSTLAMTTVDIAGAAIEAAAKSGGQVGLFFSNFALCLNYVGLGRTVIACSTDGIMGGRLNKKRKERITLVGEYLELNKEKIYYKQKDMWVSAEQTQEAIDSAVDAMKKTDEILKDVIVDNKESFIKISIAANKAEELNPGLKQSIKDTIKWE